MVSFLSAQGKLRKDFVPRDRLEIPPDGPPGDCQQAAHLRPAPLGPEKIRRESGQQPAPVHRLAGNELDPLPPFALRRFSRLQQRVGQAGRQQPLQRLPVADDDRRPADAAQPVSAVAEDLQQQLPAA